MTTTQQSIADEVATLGADVWDWRARQQPAMGDDIPRLPRPPGWLPDFSPAAVAAARQRRDELHARWSALDIEDLDVATRVDHRLIASVLSRVTWELDVLQSWRRDPVFHVHQALGPYFDLLLPLPPFGDERSAALVAALGHVPRAVENTIAVLDRPTGPLTAAALELLDGAGARLRESADALVGHLPEDHRDQLVAAVGPAVAAVDRLGGLLAGFQGLTDVVAAGETAFVWFLRNVAVMAESPGELVRRARQEWERAVVWEAVAKHRAASVVVPPLPTSAAEQVAREAAAENEVRAFYEGGGFLSQPDGLRHYLNAELPDYLAPLRFLGVCDDLTDEFRLDQDGVSYVPPPGPELPYFYAANARDPRAGIAHEGAHYQQLSLSNGHVNPLRRRYYDSGPNEGIAFYNEEYLLQAGLFDDVPHTRTVIWNFARLRALRVQADVELATGAMSLGDVVDFFVRRVPMDRQTAFEESCFYAGNPGLALSYQTGKLQLMSLIAAAVEAEGDDFSLRRIHDAIWRDGNVPFALLRWELLGDRSVLDAIDADPATGAPTPVPAWDE
jgi:Bacterial protein of unknown function (DUF885)